MKLKYGCNPHQPDASYEVLGRADNPLTLLNGELGYINLMDALTSWQLVKEAKQATGLTCAASFKHVNPAGVAVCLPGEENAPGNDGRSPVAIAYRKARYCDPLASFGDVIAVSDTVDASLAEILAREVTDLIVAPAYDGDALNILKKKRGGRYTILQIDPTHQLPARERRELFGFVLEQDRNTYIPSPEDYRSALAATVPDNDRVSLMVTNICLANIALKYTVSNSIAVATGGQVIGISAAQQSRVGSTRLACNKADKWFFSQSPVVKGLAFRDGVKSFEKNNVVDILYRWSTADAEERAVAASFLRTPPTDELHASGMAWQHDSQDICLCSDGFIPFRDNIDRAAASGVICIVHPGGGKNDDDIEAVARSMGMVVIRTGVRLFYH